MTLLKFNVVASRMNLCSSPVLSLILYQPHLSVDAMHLITRTDRLKQQCAQTHRRLWYLMEYGDIKTNDAQIDFH